MDALPVSVLVPTYNGAAFLAEALASAGRQTKLPCEILVIDDASTDETCRVAEQAAAALPVPFRLLRAGKNSGGPARPINLGLSAAAGELIAVVDQDDILLPHHLESLTRPLLAHADVSLAFGACGRADAPERPGSTWQPPALLKELAAAGEPGAGGVYFGELALARRLVAHGNLIVGYPGFVFRRADALRDGGADESLSVGSDYDLLCRLSLQGRSAMVPGVVYLRRHHGGNLSGAGAGWALDVARVARRTLARAAPAAGDDAFWTPLSRLFVRLLSGLAWAGRHRDAARLLRRARAAGAPRGEALKAAGKLVITWGWRHAGGRRWDVDAAKLDLFLADLDALAAALERRDASRAG